MSIISDLFGALMRWFYTGLASQTVEPDKFSHFAMAILLMALVSKLITIPLTYKTTKSAEKMKDLQPKMDELKAKYGYDERILQQKTMEFYKENNVSMAGCSSCLPTVIQFVLIIALFQVLREPGKYIFDNPEQFNHISKNFLWISDLSLPDPKLWYGLPLLNMIFQFLVTYLNPMTRQQQQGPQASSMAMMKFMPVMFYFISLKWSAGLLLYWVAGNALEVIFRLISGLVLKLRKGKE